MPDTIDDRSGLDDADSVVGTTPDALGGGGSANDADLAPLPVDDVHDHTVGTGPTGGPRDTRDEDRGRADRDG
jgi:hypothetical protein